MLSEVVSSIAESGWTISIRGKHEGIGVVVRSSDGYRADDQTHLVDPAGIGYVSSR
jgi:hypothetical protein